MANPNQDARNGNGKYVRTPETAQRDARAAELLSQGYSYREIAKELGYQSHTAAIQACRRACRDIVQGPAEKLIALSVDRLEYLFAKAMEIAEADHVVVSHGRIVKDDQGNTLKDSGPTLAAIREARATLESFRKLTGLDQPAKVNVSGGVRYEVVGVDPEDLT
ncbi:hypothetical protein [Streptomyces sp. NPDC002573]|uniref:hypothetical protein n=1 Tax=Streptomyces sp. NPDC002573 TaxID=3364651 RepID=UPI0036C8C706